MIKCVIIDDDSASVRILENYISKISQLQLVHTNKYPKMGLAYILENQIDLLITDICMPEMSGFELATILGERLNIIFISGYTENAEKGYKYNPIDFLFKPFSFDDFHVSINRLKKKLTLLEGVLPQYSGNAILKEENQNFVFVKNEQKGKYTKIKYEDIIWIETANNYLHIYTYQNETIVAKLSLRDLEEKLPNSIFVRCHKSFIVPIDNIKSVESNELYLIGKKKPISIGVTYRQDIIQIINKHLINPLVAK